MRKFGWILLVAGCTSSGDHKQLPSASITPHITSQQTNVACGDDIAWDGHASPDIRYAFTYDNTGALAHADGAYTAGGTDDTIDYSYDAAGAMTHMLETRGYGDSRVEITANYDASENLQSYVYDVSAAQYHDNWTYAYSQYTGALPAREDITEQGQPSFGYTLVWDASERLTQAIPDSGPTTTYTYDDQAGTITADTGNGAWTDVMTYDAQFHELSDVWGGSDPSAYVGSDVFAWQGDQLETITYSSGTEQQPKTPTVMEVDTLRYSCANARAATQMRFARPGARR